MPAQKPPAPARVWSWRSTARSPGCICVLLAVTTLAVYWPVGRADFITYDDIDYVVENKLIAQGLSWRGVVWALETGHSGNWHPVTWISHMLDVQLFGLQPGPHHLVSLLFHIANTILLFLLLQNMTKALWRSAFVAALFAVHPLHVESVAWVAERKDVLSTFFGLLAIWAYASHAKAEGRGQNAEWKARHCASRFTVHVSRSYLLSLALFALSLMCKPMLVTLPFLLVLLDYWPLGRLSLPQPHYPFSLSLRLILEKLPFLLLSLVSSVITVLAQRAGHALLTVDALPLGPRVGNALVSYVRYLGKAVWPSCLALPYPYPGSWPMAVVLLAGLGLAAGSVVALWWAHRRPYVVVGWFWFLGTLVPVIGLVQVGSQALADRYTYLPRIGLFVLFAWVVVDWSKTWRYRRVGLAAGSSAMVLLCITLARIQAGYWRNSETLFRHTLRVTTDNATAHACLGTALLNQERLADALTQFSRALTLRPAFAKPLASMAQVLCTEGRLDAAAALYYSAGDALLKAGQAGAAIEQFQQAVRLRPDWAEALNNFAWLLATHPKAEVRDGVRAVSLAERACALTQRTNLWLLSTLAAAYAEAGQFPEALSTQQKVCDLGAAEGQNAQAESFQRRLELYRSGHAYHKP